jgi:hypothetical protein
LLKMMLLQFLIRTGMIQMPICCNQSPLLPLC